MKKIFTLIYFAIMALTIALLPKKLKAQFNIQEGFETASLPTGWTNNGFGFFTNSGFAYSGTSYASAFINLGSDRSLTTSSQTSDGGAIEVSIKYRKQPNQAGFVSLSYTVGASPTLNTIVSEGFGTAFVPYRTLSGFIPAGTVPAGATIKFVIRAAGQAGTNSEVMFDEFNAMQGLGIASLPITYTFDNVRTNAAGYNAFTTPNTSFVSDRNNNANQAMQIVANANGTIANIPVIPKGSNARTISLWYKTASNAGSPAVFAYGTAAANQTFGLYLGANGNPIFQANTNDKDFGGTFAANIWQHAVITYDGAAVKLYMNGVLLGSETIALNTGNNSDLKLGNALHLLEVDELKIFNTALTASEIADLYNPTVATSAPILSSISTNVTSNSANINYGINPNGGQATSVVKYGLTSNNLSNQVTGFPASGPIVINGTTLISPLLPNTLYYYQIEATNTAGTTTSAIDNFTTSNLTGAIAEYTFNSTYNNIQNNTPFANIPGTTSFVADRNSVAGNALQVANAQTFSNATAPIGNTSRSISLWYKSSINNGYPGLFSYGAASQYNTFGVYLTPNGSVVFQGNNYDHDFLTPYAANVWRHLVITYDGTNVKIFMNGTLAGTIARPLLNTTVSNFRLGNNTVAIQFDDLKIFDYALSGSDVSNLYTNNSTTLPVNLISFTAKVQNNAALLSWETASETNNSHFEVKRSIDGVNFNILNTVAAKSVNGAKYQLIDYSPVNGTNYYQLLQVDLDGKTTDLGVKMVSFNLKNTTKVFPNPTTDKIEVTFELGIYTKAKLVDVNGKALQSLTISATQTSVSFDLRNNMNGIYLIQLVGEKETSTQKIIKQ